MDLNETLQTIDYAAQKDDRWMFVALLVIGLITIGFLARNFMRQIAALQREIAKVRSDFESHLKTANAEMVAALTRSTEVIEHNSTILEQIHRQFCSDLSEGEWLDDQSAHALTRSMSWSETFRAARKGLSVAAASRLISEHFPARLAEAWDRGEAEPDLWIQELVLAALLGNVPDPEFQSAADRL